MKYSIYLSSLKNTGGFSIIEVLVGIFIFSLGLVSVFMLITSSLNLNELNKNKILASNLAREQIELFRNIRDTNYQTLHNWNQINPQWEYSRPEHFFSTGSYYTLENNFSWGFSVTTNRILDFWEGPWEVGRRMKDYQLYRDPEGVYTYISSGNTPTYFYRFLEILPVEYSEGWATKVIPNAFRIISKVIWYKRGYHQMEIDTIVTDWRRI